jgi:hypothetical protein
LNCKEVQTERRRGLGRCIVPSVGSTMPRSSTCSGYPSDAGVYFGAQMSRLQQKVYERVGMAVILVEYKRPGRDPRRTGQWDPAEQEMLCWQFEQKSPFENDSETQTITII